MKQVDRLITIIAYLLAAALLGTGMMISYLFFKLIFSLFT